jgi:hypothetical protein
MRQPAIKSANICANNFALICAAGRFKQKPPPAKLQKEPAAMIPIDMAHPPAQRHRPARDKPNQLPNRPNCFHF